MKMKLTLVTIMFALLATLILGFARLPSASAEGATIWTDKPDYSSGETVTIFGSGFNASAVVTVTIERPDGTIDTVYAVADDVGSFTCTYQLDGIVGTYTVTATDGTNTATTTFTDARTAPTDLTAAAGVSTATYSRIDLSWKDASDDEDLFVIERRIPPGGAYSEIATVASTTKAGTGTTYGYTDTGVTEGIVYQYQVKARTVNPSPPPDSWTGSASVLKPTATAPPKAPSLLSAIAASASQINLAWTDNSAVESDFHIERATSGSGPFAEIATVSVNVVTYPDTGLSSGTTYYYQVRAHHHASGTYSGYSNVASATTQAPVIQYYITVTSAHGSPYTASGWVNAGSDFTASVTDPDVVAADHQWICTGHSVDGAPIEAGSSHTFTAVGAAHTISFSWQEQWYITVTSAHG